jgi:cystathionine beta-lyase/cystathionine gamma-synthase
LEGVHENGGTMLFGSGMSGITSALMSVLKAGDHAVFPYTVYGGTHEFLKEFAVHWGVEIDFIDGAGKQGPEAYRAAFRDNTKVVYCETPANPTCRITDLRGVGRVVDEFFGKRENNPNRPWVMVDGTFATPYHQRSLDIPGVDVSIHSCTKYLGGHSDILAGSVSSNSPEFCHGLAKVQKLITAPLNVSL